MIIVIGKKDKELVNTIRNYLINHTNRYLSTRDSVIKDKFNYMINGLSKALHIKN